MDVIRSEVLGFCMGVRRATELAVEEAKKAKANNERIYTLGPLIHNPQTLAELKNLGVEILDEKNCLKENEKAAVVVRAHGTGRKEEKKLIDSGYRIIDATCPKVKAVQLKAQELAKEGFFIFLAGDAEHAEIKGILGYIEDEGNPRHAVIGTEAQAREAAESLYKTDSKAKTALLGQTTIREEEYLKIGEEIKKYFLNLEIVNTICAAAAERQKALRKMLDNADAVIIAGGKESANTRILFEIAKETGKPCVLAESARDIPDIFHTFQTVGISAGASTPDSVISEIELELQR